MKTERQVSDMKAEGYIALSVPNLKGKELDYVTEAVKTEWVSTGGPYIKDFENAIADYVHVPAAVACQSGTAGLHLALLALGIGAGEEVIVPTLTFIAAVNPVRYVGAEPVFMDCDDSLTMDPDKLESFCREECDCIDGTLIHKSSGRRIRAVVVVHVFGNMADMERIMQVAERYHLKVVEDATEALGTYYLSGKYAGRYAGTIGDIGVYSFNGNKIITTGGGGMVVSQDSDLVERCRFLSTQAKKDVVYFVHEEIGYNYRMTNLQAALGLAQMEQLEDFVRIKTENYEEYQRCGLNILPFRKGIRSNHWFYSFLSKDRDGLIKYLDSCHIQSRPVWQLLHTLKPYQEAQTYKIEKALWYYDRIVNIPCSSNLTKEDIARVAACVREYENRVG